jgi:amidase
LALESETVFLPKGVVRHMLRISSDNCVYSMNPNNRPVAEVPSGAEVVFETKDCFSNRVHSEQDLFQPGGWSGINPATGPLRVTGAQPGDVLAVEILDIAVAPQGAMITVPGMGALGHHITHNQTKIIPVRGGEAVFNDKLRLPVRPMIGVIGTAPADSDVPCGTPGPHGGNMDTKLIAPGVTLYLPVYVDGANLAIGDLHALMADGEVVICGVELPGEVRVRVTLIQGSSIPSPVLETADHLYCIASGEDLDGAATLALDHTMGFLRERLPLPVNEIAMLMSLVCDLQISQVVDPLKTARVAIPKQTFAPYGLRF